MDQERKPAERGYGKPAEAPAGTASQAHGSSRPLDPPAPASTEFRFKLSAERRQELETEREAVRQRLFAPG